MFKTINISQYLFRTFNRKISGKSNDNIVALIASVTKLLEESRKDLLFFLKHKAINMLHTYLTKQCYGREDSDNLMS
jgi:hypothetical protein